MLVATTDSSGRMPGTGVVRVGLPLDPPTPGPPGEHAAEASLRCVLRRHVRIAAGGGLLGMVVLGVCVAYVRAAARGHLFDERSVPTAPVALVLGAQVYPSGMPSAFLRARLDLGQRLLASGKVDVLLVSGAADAPEYDEPKAMRAYLEAAGVPAERIVEDRYGRDTYDSCVRAQRVFGVDEVVLVSQGYHLPRAVGTARRLGLSARGAGDDTVRNRREPWISGTIRDQVACVKTVYDLFTHREPVLGPPDGSVTAALRSAQQSH
jgi:vancomycin permeability regulator SanA